MSGWDRRWWQQADQFHWFSVYLRDRGLDRQWRLATFAFTLLFAAVPVVMLRSPYGPGSGWARAVAIAAAGCGVGVGVVWLIGWPSRTQSLVFHAVCCLSIAAGTLSLSTAYGALMGCAMFAAVGGLLAYFHALVHVLANFAVAAISASVAAARLFAETGDTALVVASLLLVLGLNLGVPFGIHALVHSLHSELRCSDVDPLTGLPNRRSFYNSVHEMLLQRRAGHAELHVTMIDVDDFKKLNDTRGHAVGDEALVGIGAVLAEHSGADAAVGRLGGEEFVIADMSSAATHAVTAERIRLGIAALPVQITASLGTCGAVLGPAAVVEPEQFLDGLIRAADLAMYRSKRAGGNRIHRSDATATSP